MSSRWLRPLGCAGPGNRESTDVPPPSPAHLPPHPGCVHTVIHSLWITASGCLPIRRGLSTTAPALGKKGNGLFLKRPADVGRRPYHRGCRGALGVVENVLTCTNEDRMTAWT